ncbi:MAG: hypothetical protein HQ546_04670 [Planctomycetes bacterium]|nr:hypothetical protein [Planctomycetota bacterium]
MAKQNSPEPDCSSQPQWDGPDRRKQEESGRERRNNMLDRRLGLDRRRGPGRRRSDSRRMAEEGEMTEDQFEFVLTIEKYKQLNNRPFPSWTEVLDVIRALGYRKVAEPTALE